MRKRNLKAFVGALAGDSLPHRHDHAFMPLSADERQSLCALIYSIAANSNVAADTLSLRLKAVFDTDDIGDICRGQYRDAIRYLVDFMPDLH